MFWGVKSVLMKVLDHCWPLQVYPREFSIWIQNEKITSPHNVVWNFTKWQEEIVKHEKLKNSSMKKVTKT
jgi:hypothetical protein